MDSNVTFKQKKIKSSLFVIIFLVVLVSIIPEILFSEMTGSIPGWLHYGRLAVLALIAISLRLVAPLKHLSKFVLLLIANSFGHILVNLVAGIEAWTDVFPINTFLGSYLRAFDLLGNYSAHNNNRDWRFGKTEF